MDPKAPTKAIFSVHGYQSIVAEGDIYARELLFHLLLMLAIQFFENLGKEYIDILCTTLQLFCKSKLFPNKEFKNYFKV